MLSKYNYFNRLKRFLFSDLPNFFKNVWLFRKALWSHQWWDYSGSLYFLEISIGDISKNLKTKGLEVEHSRFKKIDKMNRVVEILKNIREHRYFDIVEKELGRGYNTKNIQFIHLEENPDYFELVDYDSDEKKEFNNKYFERVTELENEEWVELWEILNGQDYKKFDPAKDWDDQFDGSGIKGWWD